jgi:hypothetical protein
MFQNRMLKKNQKKNPIFLTLSFISVPRDVPGRDGTGCQNPVPSRGKIFSLSRCPFVPGQGRNFCPFVPKSCTVPSRWKRYSKLPQLKGLNSSFCSLLSGCTILMYIVCTVDSGNSKLGSSPISFTNERFLLLPESIIFSFIITCYI